MGSAPPPDRARTAAPAARRTAVWALKFRAPTADTTFMLLSDDPSEAIWVVEASADGLDWQTFWASPKGPMSFTRAEAMRLVRVCQSAQDTLEWTCQVAARTWRLRNLRTGDCILAHACET